MGGLENPCKVEALKNEGAPYPPIRWFGFHLQGGLGSTCKVVWVPPARWIGVKN